MDKEAVKKYIIAKVQTHFKNDPTANKVINYLFENIPIYSKNLERYAIRKKVEEGYKSLIREGCSNPKRSAMYDASIHFDCSEKTVHSIIYILK